MVFTAWSSVQSKQPMASSLDIADHNPCTHTLLQEKSKSQIHHPSTNKSPLISPQKDVARSLQHRCFKGTQLAHCQPHAHLPPRGLGKQKSRQATYQSIPHWNSHSPAQSSLQKVWQVTPLTHSPKGPHWRATRPRRASGLARTSTTGSEEKSAMRGSMLATTPRGRAGTLGAPRTEVAAKAMERKVVVNCMVVVVVVWVGKVDWEFNCGQCG